MAVGLLILAILVQSNILFYSVLCSPVRLPSRGSQNAHQPFPVKPYNTEKYVQNIFRDPCCLYCRRSDEIRVGTIFYELLHILDSSGKTFDPSALVKVKSYKQLMLTFISCNFLVCLVQAAKLFADNADFFGDKAIVAADMQVL